MLHFFWVCLLMAIPLILVGQPISDNGNWLKFKGNIQAQQTFKYRSGLPHQYGHQLLATLDFNIWRVKLPFSMIYVDQNFTYQHPFKRFRLAPKYKWLQLHLGNQIHHLSEYSLKGKPINGIGITIKPPKSIDLSVIYGNIEPGIRPLSDTTYQPNGQKAIAVKMGLRPGTDQYELIYFQSFNSEKPISATILENTILESRIAKYLAPKLSFKADLAWSKTSTMPSSDVQFNQQLFKSGFGVVNAYAMNYQLNYQLPGVVAGLQMERITPEFQSAGLVNQNPDLQSITTNLALILSKQKIRMSSRLGVQHDNLNHQKIKTTSRLAARFSFQWQSRDNWICNLNGSNIIQQIQPQNLLTDWNFAGDTILLRQINTQGNFNLRKVFQKKSQSEKNQQLSILSSVQQAYKADGSGFESFYIKSEYQWSSKHFQFAVFTAYNSNFHDRLSNNFFTPGLKLSAKREKVQWHFQSGCAWNFNPHTQDKVRFNHRLNLSYPVNKRQKLLGSLMAVNSPGDQIPFQISSRISYQYQL